jgi:hypothetical protein
MADGGFSVGSPGKAPLLMSLPGNPQKFYPETMNKLTLPMLNILNLKPVRELY